jgi:ABC-2 type transport system permease protein
VPSTALLSRLDGSGIFQRQAILEPRRGYCPWIDTGRALLVIQFDQDFERRLLAGDAAPLEVIADGRNSNTAGTRWDISARWWRTSTATGG